MPYEPINENRIEHQYEQRRTIDVTLYEQELKELEDQMKNIATEKTAPDQETLRFWNEFNANTEEKQRIIDRVRYIVNDVLQPIHDAGKLPGKWNGLLNKYKNWLDKQ